MKAEAIVNQLKRLLPIVTNLFSDEIQINSLYQDSGLAIATCNGKHNLKTGDLVNITGALIKNPIISLDREGEIATAKTQFMHDLTYNYWPQKTNISGADQQEYNGDFVVYSPTYRNEFNFKVSGTPNTPATGNIVLNEDRYAGFNGLHIITVIDETKFSYPLIDTLDFMETTGDIKCRYNTRVSRAATPQRALDSYTQNKNNGNKLWAFVILGDVSVTKDRNIETDATQVISAGDRLRQRLINQFAVHVFFPSPSTSAGDTRDLAEDVAIYLWASLLRSYFPTGLKLPVWSQTTTFGHGIVADHQSLYIHEYKFEAVSDIGQPDAIPPEVNTAFQEVQLRFLNKDTDMDIVDLSVNVLLNSQEQ